MTETSKGDDHKTPSHELSKLLHRLEYLVGKECYNDNIQNYGPWGEWEGEGRGFRYPVRFSNSEGLSEKYKGTFPFTKSVTGEQAYCVLGPERMNTAHYAFGANQLFVFRGLMRILEHLDRQFGLSFEQMLSEQTTRNNQIQPKDE